MLGDTTYLETAYSVCKFILDDLPRRQVTADSLCISYIPGFALEIHNANILAASLLARVYQHTQDRQLIEVARQAVQYTMNHQRPDGSWFYGEGLRWHWVDGYHTGFVLDSLYWYQKATGDTQFQDQLRRGMEYYRQSLFTGNIPKHFSNSIYPIDIQAVAQAIQTFALIPEEYNGDPAWSEQVARWSIENMQDPSGYFYFRKYRLMNNKTAFLHWGQGTMLAALVLLLQRKLEFQELDKAISQIQEAV